MANRFQVRRGTAAHWASSNPVLADGEPGLERDTGKIKYGNGAAAWNDLPYASAGPQGPAGVADDTSVAALIADPTSEVAGELSATYATAAALAGKADSAALTAKLDKTEAAATYATPSSVEAQVPPLVADAIASDSTVVDAAAVAVSAEMADKDLLLSTDQRVPRIATSAEHLAVFLDSLNQETWLGARASDGGPTDWAIHHLANRLGVGPMASPDYLVAVADADKNLTDLTISKTDGQFAQFVIDRLKPRILDDFNDLGNRLYADIPYTPGTEVFPVETDTTKAAGFGSSSMAGLDYRMMQLFQSKGATYYQGGRGSEKVEHATARLGSVPMLLDVAGGSIPASGPVDVTSSNVPLSQYVQPFPGTLAGVHGTLSYRADPASFVFTRTTAGNATPVPNGSALTPDASIYRDGTLILWLGKGSLGYEGGDDKVIAHTNKTVDWMAPLKKRFLVLGHFVDTGYPAVDFERSQIQKVNAAYKARYGKLYVDISGYVTSSQVWTDTGITPTAEDLAEQALGNKPPSLSMDIGHFNQAGYDAIRDFLIIPRFNELGW